jgi:hypothetical protein
MSSYDQVKNDQPVVDDISHLPDEVQAECIAEQFASIQNQYQAIQKDDISIPPHDENQIPQFYPSQVWFALSRLDANKATVQGDVPAKLIKQFAAYSAEPLADIYNTGLRRGEYPELYKFEVCTPVPKVHPTQTTAQLRNISGLINFDKIYEPRPASRNMPRCLAI